MINGLIVFVCDDCGHQFTVSNPEWSLGQDCSEVYCPKCGGKHVYPTSRWTRTFVECTTDVGVKREWLLQTEDRIQRMVDGVEMYDLEEVLMNFSTEKMERLEELLFLRAFILNSMFDDPTTEEIEMITDTNNLWKKMTNKVYEDCEDCIDMVCSMIKKISKDWVFTITPSMAFDDMECWGLNRVTKSDYYGSFFTYMVPLISMVTKMSPRFETDFFLDKDMTFSSEDGKTKVSMSYVELFKDVNSEELKDKLLPYFKVKPGDAMDYGDDDDDGLFPSWDEVHENMCSVSDDFSRIAFEPAMNYLLSKLPYSIQDVMYMGVKIPEVKMAYSTKPY